MDRRHSHTDPIGGFTRLLRRSFLATLFGMAIGGGPRGVRFSEAYRFFGKVGGAEVEGITYKREPRRTTWEARIDKLSVVASGETRAEAVGAALEQAGHRR